MDGNAELTRRMVFNWLVQGHRYRTLIDIGANDGAFGAFLQRTFGFERVCAFEPLSRHGQALASRGFEVFSIALSDENHDSDLVLTEADSASSLMQPTERCQQVYPQARPIAVERVSVRRLDDVIPPLEDELMIKLDAQGAEARIIRGGQVTFQRARAVLVEMTFAPLYEGGSLFEEVHAELVALGLRFRGIRGQHEAPSGEPLFAHCVYLRD